MKLSSIQIKGWRSYNDQDGITLKDLKKINLIIGPNNAGKSNLPKFFQLIKNLFESVKFDESRVELPAVYFNNSIYSEHITIEENDYWDLNSKEFHAELFFEDVEAIHTNATKFENYKRAFGNSFVMRIACAPAFNRDTSEIRLHPLGPIPFSYIRDVLNRIERKSNTSLQQDAKPYSEAYSEISKKLTDKFQNPDYPLVPLAKLNEQGKMSLLRNFSLDRIETNQFVDPSGASEAQLYPYQDLMGSALDTLFCISPIRDHSRDASNLGLGVDGGEIIAKCKELKDRRNTFAWGQFRSKIQSWLTEILNEPKMDIDFDDKTIRFWMDRNGNQIGQYLHHLGTGVSQLFMLFSYLLFNKDRTLNVFIDEPENSLHTHSLVLLVQKLSTEPEFEKHRFFICTHAASLMDMVSDDWTVHKVSMSREKGTAVQPCTDLVSKHELLDEMGIRASHILQSNFVIWVEGPSDRIYLRKWIEIVSNKTLKEGKHYSFAFYGGSVLKHYRMGDPQDEDLKEYISLFSTSRYSLVMMDSDKSHSSDGSKTIVTKMREASDTADPKNRFINIWETAGREIENYVPRGLWNAMIPEERLWRKKGKDENGSEFEPNLEFPDKKDFNQFEDFTEYLLHFYRLETEPLPAFAHKSFRSFHDGKKVEIAKFMAGKWDTLEINDWPWDLHERVSSLVEAIKWANGL